MMVLALVWAVKLSPASLTSLNEKPAEHQPDTEVQRGHLLYDTNIMQFHELKEFLKWMDLEFIRV